MLQIENLHKSFDDFKAVNGAHLSVESGQLVAVIGPNGAGKTTLFRLLTGQEQADAGQLRLGETVQIAYVDQSRDALNDANAGLGF